MHQAAVFLRLKLVIQHVRVARQVLHVHAGAQHVHVGLDVFDRMLHGIDHVGAGFVWPDPP